MGKKLDMFFRIVPMKFLILVGIVVIAVGGLGTWYATSPEAKNFMVYGIRTVKVEELVRLCSVEIYEDYALKDSVDDRHLFARMLVRGSISFDVEHLNVTTEGDSVVVVLPLEIVEIYEATDDDAYELIDRWDSNNREAPISNAEENAMKLRAKERIESRLYENGTVRRARLEASETLASLMRKVYRKPVRVIDPAPYGTPE